MKIGRRDEIDSLSSEEALRLRKSKGDEDRKTRTEVTREDGGESVKISSIAQLLNDPTLVQFDSSDNSEKVKRLREQYQKGELRYDSEEVARRLIDELSTL